MLLQHIVKKISFIFCFIILSNTLPAQKQQTNAFLYKEFIAADNLKINSKFFLVITRLELLEPFLKSGSLSIARQLNDTVFIIKNNSGALSFKNIFPANNNW